MVTLFWQCFRFGTVEGFAGQSLWWHWWRKAHSSWAVWYGWKSNNRGFSPKWIWMIWGYHYFQKHPIWYASSHQISLRSKVKTSQGQGAEATQHGCWGWIWPSAVSFYQFLTIQPLGCSESNDPMAWQLGASLCQMLWEIQQLGLTILGDRFRPKSIDQLCSPQNLQQSLSSRQLPWSNLTSLETNSFTLQCLRFRISTVTSTARPSFPIKRIVGRLLKLSFWHHHWGFDLSSLPTLQTRKPKGPRSHWRYRCALHIYRISWDFRYNWNGDDAIAWKMWWFFAGNLCVHFPQFQPAHLFHSFCKTRSSRPSTSKQERLCPFYTAWRV